MSAGRRVLVTGATGYVGGRLLPALLARGERVRCLTRRPEAIAPRPGLEVVAGDALDAEAVRRALDGVDVAYYLIHAMGAAEGFEERDRRAATVFAQAARDAGVGRIVYLGGLGSGPGLSTHLASRQEVGRLLASTGLQTIEFRASIVIGSGSLSFELVRSLTERLPVMITPRWVRTRAQPIAIEDVIAYLVGALDLEAVGSEVFEIGGAEIATYGELMREYARQRGLRRLLVPVPVLTPRLSSLWLGLVTPLYARVGRKLVESLPAETVVNDPRALERFPVRPRGYREAIARALLNEDRAFAETRWSDALSSGERRTRTGGGHVRGRLVDSRVREVPVAPARAFAPIRRIGGPAGWYYGNTLWQLRGLLDLLVGGVGLRRGRRDPETPTEGSALDFWRVEAYEPDRLLRLRAEMRLPGRAWLQFEVDGDEHGSTIRQTAIFDPAGLAGLLYWYALLPLHRLVFAGMLGGIARRAAPPAARLRRPPPGYEVGMSYAKTNLRSVADSAAGHGLSGTQEARFPRTDLGAEQTGMNLLTVKPSQREAFAHRHRRAEEVYVVLSGSGQVKLDDELVELAPLDAVRVGPGVARCFEAGPDGLEVLIFGPHVEGDSEMVADFWGPAE